MMMITMKLTMRLSIDPLHVCGNAANLEYRTIRLFYRSENFFCFVLQFGCIPTDVKGVYILLITDSDLFLTSLLRFVDEIKTTLLPYNWKKSQVVLLGWGFRKLKIKLKE